MIYTETSTKGRLFETVFFLKLTALLLVLLSSTAVSAQTVPAHSLQDHFQVNHTISDGKDGRPWRQWKQKIRESAVEEVSITLRRESGGNDTYVNLRYEGGQTFENGKRVFLKSGDERTVKWRLDSTTPNGKPLALKAYNGVVYVQTVNIRYKSPKLPFTSVPRPTPPTVGSGPAPTSDEAEILARCRNAHIRRPRINMSGVSSKGGIFSGKYKLKGNVFGMCIQEVGYFEQGHLKEKISFPLDDRFQRQEFKVKARSGRNGEIRVYTTDGQEDIIDVDREIQNQGS